MQFGTCPALVLDGLPRGDMFLEMKIHTPVHKQMGSEFQISAQIEWHEKTSKYVRNLWFRFPLHWKEHISMDIDPFVVALLLLAMQLGEPLEVEGTMSQQILAGLNEYQRIYHSWFPDRFQCIEIRPIGLRAVELKIEECESGCASAFSGGVDSFYTLLKHPAEMTHALFMAGFDMPLNLKASIQQLTDSYTQMMAQKGISFIIGSTNIRNFVNTVDWTNAHGQALIAAALFFKKKWKTFFIPSSYLQHSYPKWGTHPSLDPLLSTKELQFVHHGSNATRLDKLATIVQDPMSYDRLRVCWIQDIGLKNCGKCEKCIRTMTALDILGSLFLYRTFGEDFERLGEKIRSLPQRTYQARLFARELIWAALRRGKFNRAYDLGYSLLMREWRRHGWKLG